MTEPRAPHRRPRPSFARGWALIFVAIAALLAAGLAACGGGNNEDPSRVLHETFSGGKNYTSGVVDITLSASTSGGQAQGFGATIKGPFQSVPGGFPKFNLQAQIKSSTFPFSGGLTSTGTGAFVNVQGSDYQIPQATFNTFKQLYQGFQSQASKAGGTGGPSLSSFFTDLKNNGTTNVNGTNAIHVSGKLDVQKLVAAAKLASGGSAVGLQALGRAGSAISGITVDIYSEESTKRLVRLDAAINFNQTSASPAGQVKFSLGFSNLGQPQTISPPTNARPIGQLLNALKGQLGAIGGGGGSGGASPNGSSPPAGATQGYLNCLQQARGQAAITACAKQLTH